MRRKWTAQAARRTSAVVALLAVLAAAAPARATPDEGRAFAVRPVPPGRFAVKTPTDAERFWVDAAGGVRVFVEVWLPARKGRAVPPKRVPVVVAATPYAFKGLPFDRLSAQPRWTDFFVSRGFAVATVHLRGTGESDGCWNVHDRVDADDISRAIEMLTAAPFSTGRIALFGKSHPGGAAINAAARGHRHRLRGLRAVISTSPVLSYTDFSVYDGVPMPTVAAQLVQIDTDTSLAGRASAAGPNAVHAITHGRKDPAALAQRLPCRPAQATGMLDTDGRMTPWMAERELAAMTGQITVPTLMSYGLQEVQSRHLVGAFDGIRARKAGVFAQSGHDYPDENTFDPDFGRADWEAMVYAWVDQWLRGADHDVERWPVAQVQDTEGQWRAEPGFPRTRGPAAQLALGPDATLGATRPTGSTSYDETTAGAVRPVDTPVFSTPALAGPLELVGEVHADLWVTLDKPAAHIAAELRAYDADGREVRGSLQVGVRSARFLGRLPGGRFLQMVPADPPVGEPVRVTVRFPPNDVTVPEGGRLELVLSGYGPESSLPSMQDTRITVHHDCAHPSALRFALPRADRDLLDVLDATDAEGDPLGVEPRPRPGLRDGAGLASAPVCGRPPSRRG